MGCVHQLVFDIEESLPELRGLWSDGGTCRSHFGMDRGTDRGSCKSLPVLGDGVLLSCWPGVPSAIPVHWHWCGALLSHSHRALCVLRAVWLLHRDPACSCLFNQAYSSLPSLPLLFMPFLAFVLFGG